MTRQVLSHDARPLAPIRGETVYVSAYGDDCVYEMPVTIPVVMAMRPKNRPLEVTWVVDLNRGGRAHEPQTVLDPSRRGRGFRKRVVRSG